MDLLKAREHIISLLNRELRPDYFYHCVAHTLDVHSAACQLISMEPPTEVPPQIIETAALFHDAGMITQYKNHEEASVSIARQLLPTFGYNHEEIETIGRLIMITKLPQRAVTPAEQILCDADLDYLGRDDFYVHSFALQHEWNTHQIKHTTLREWLEIQVSFLSEHHYFTVSARQLREKSKLKHLNEIKNILSSSTPQPVNQQPNKQ